VIQRGTEPDDPSVEFRRHTDLCEERLSNWRVDSPESVAIAETLSMPLLAKRAFAARATGSGRRWQPAKRIRRFSMI
jgi:hypothetical protein